VKIYIPGRGSVDTLVYKVDRAVSAYDERLFFDQNANTGDWCVFIKMPRPERPYPVLGFGDAVPSVDAAMLRLKQADTMRTGNQIYDEIVKSQEDYRKALTYNTDQAGEESAEVLEHFLRRHGKSPVIKEFISKDIPKEVVKSDA